MNRIKHFFLTRGWFYTLGLTLIQKELFALIYGYTAQGAVMDWTIDELCSYFNASEPTIVKALNELARRDLVDKRNYRENRAPRCKYRISEACIGDHIDEFKDPEKVKQFYRDTLKEFKSDTLKDIKRDTLKEFKSDKEPQTKEVLVPDTKESLVCEAELPYYNNSNNGSNSDDTDVSSKSADALTPSPDSTPAVEILEPEVLSPSVPAHMPTSLFDEEEAQVEDVTPVEVLHTNNPKPAAGEKKKKRGAKKEKDNIMPWDEYEQMCIDLGADFDDAAEHAYHREKKHGVNTPYAIKHIRNVLTELQTKHGIDPGRVFHMAAVGQWRGIEVRYVLDQVAREQHNTPAGGYGRPAPVYQNKKPGKFEQNSDALAGALEKLDSLAPIV